MKRKMIHILQFKYSFDLLLNAIAFWTANSHRMHVDRAQTRIHTLENGSVFEKCVTTVRPINKRVNLFFDDTLTDWPTHLFCYLIYAWCVFGLCHIAFSVSFSLFVCHFGISFYFFVLSQSSKNVFIFLEFCLRFILRWYSISRGTSPQNRHTHTESAKEFTPSIWIPLQIYLHTFLWIV